jgi:O-antigen ligase
LNYDRDSKSVWVLIIGVWLITLYFNDKINDPINTPKLIVLIITSGWLLGHIIDHCRKIDLKSKGYLYLMIPGLFVTSQFVALMHTDNLYIGFFGETQRRNGFLSYLALTIILVFSAIKINYYYINRILKSTIILGFILCGYGILQISGRDFIEWINPNNSMILTVGNPNFASSLLALMVLVGFFSIFLGQISAIYKFLSGTVVVLSLILIIKSQSRQGLVVVLFALLFYITLYAIFNLKRIRFLVTTISIVIFVFAVLGMLQIGPFKSFLYKDSVSARGYYWRAAIEMFKENPLWGVGLDRYGAYFKEFREPAYALINGYTLTSSNAHNTILQLLGTGGIFVFLSYFMLLVLIFTTGLKNIKNSEKEEQKINLLLLAVWIGFQTQSFISIDNLALAIWGWLFGGSILAIGRFSNLRKIENLIDRKPSKTKVNIQFFQPITSALILIPTIFISVNLNRMESDMYTIRAFSNSNIIEYRNVAINATNRIFDSPFADPTYKFMASTYLADIGLSEKASSVLANLNKKDPRDLNVLLTLAEFEKRNGNIEQVIQFRLQISEIDPWNAENFLELGKAYKEINDLTNAKRMKQIIMNLAPDTLISQSAELELS